MFNLSDEVKAKLKAVVSLVLTGLLIVATVGIWSGWDKGEYGNGFKWFLTGLLAVGALSQLKWGADKYCAS